MRGARKAAPRPENMVLSTFPKMRAEFPTYHTSDRYLIESQLSHTQNTSTYHTSNGPYVRRTIRPTYHTSNGPYVRRTIRYPSFLPFSVEAAAFPSARSIPRIKNRILHSTVLSYRLSITSKFTSTYHTSAASTHHTSDAPYVENRRTIRRTYLPSRTTSTLDYNPYGHLTTFQLTHNS